MSGPSSFPKQFTDFTGTKDSEGHALLKGLLTENCLTWIGNVHMTSLWLWLCAVRLIQPCKVKEVSGQSVAHLNWQTAACCSTCASPPNTERYCSLLTDAWHFPAEMVPCYQGFIKMRIPVKRWFLPVFETCHTGERFWRLLCWGSHLVLFRIMWDVIPSDLSRALLW